jgi:hypothetical protein
MSPENWKSFFEFGGVVLLALTFIFGAGALFFSHQVNALQEEHLRQFDKDLTEAKRALGEQQERAANADARVASLEQDAANAKTIAATAEQSLLELQQHLAHRRISKSDHDKFVASLLPYQGSAVALTEFGELEAGQFADDIISVFRDAKWNVALSLKNTISPPFYSLVYYVDESSEAGKHLAAILRQLPTASVRSGTARVLNQGVVANIIVGIKPPA